MPDCPSVPFAVHLALFAALLRLAHEGVPAPAQLLTGCDYLASTRPPPRGLLRADAERLALAYLGRFTADRSAPPEFSVRRCQPECLRIVGATPGCGHVYTESLADDEACSRWRCDVAYGDDRYFPAMTTFTIDVDRGGGDITDDLGITRCLTRRHGCRLFIPRAVQRTLTLWRTQEHTRYLEWDRTRGEFVWAHVDDRPAIAAHRGPA